MTSPSIRPCSGAVVAALVGALCALVAPPAEADLAPPQPSRLAREALPDSPDPADAHSPVRALAHRSSLGRRAPATEPTLGDWRAANERVRAIGGWRVYLREAQP